MGLLPCQTLWVLSSVRGIHPFSEFLTRLEVDGGLSGQFNRLPGFGVAPYSWLAMVQRKPAKPANFDALAIPQREAHPVEERLHGGFNLVGW